jgi:sRNA-binding regulator protein Hfq
MGYLIGLNEYLEAHYHESVFDQAVLDGQRWEIHVHPHRIFQARIMETVTYDVTVDTGEGERETLPKVQIKFLYPAELADSVKPLLMQDTKVEAQNLGPHFSPRYRHHVKNKTLFPLMNDRTVLFFTLLEGEVLKGIVAGFNRYEITVHVKGGLPITVLRHSIHDIRDKRGQCFLKKSQEKREGWKKSSLYVAEDNQKPS